MTVVGLSTRTRPRSVGLPLKLPPVARASKIRLTQPWANSGSPEDRRGTIVTTIPITSPPAITFETTAGIVQRHSDLTDPMAEPAWTAQSKAHCRLMAPMSNDKRIEYLGTAGCDDDTVRFITRTVADSIGMDAKRALRTAARECAEAEEDIESLLDRWPEPQHFQLLNSKIAHLNDEQVGLATAYAACQIYEMAATALYLAIVDGMAPVVTEEEIRRSHHGKGPDHRRSPDTPTRWPDGPSDHRFHLRMRRTQSGRARISCRISRTSSAD